MRRFLRLGKVRAGLGILALMGLVAVAGPWLASAVLGVGPLDVDYDRLGTPPGGGHLLGTTTSGQDVAAQLLVGARGSLFVGLVAAVLSTTLAVGAGLAAGFFGGRVDAVVNLVINLFLVMPVLPLIVVVAGYVPNTSGLVLAVIIGLFGWAAGARGVRAQAASLSRRDFVVALRLVGESRRRLMFGEVLPHLVGWISALFLASLIGAVLAESGLRFIGIGDVNATTWGGMIAAAQSGGALLGGMWWWFFPPGLCIALLGTAAGLVNFGIDELIDPKLAARPGRGRRRRLATGATREVPS